jgi:hypothetical protein
MSKINKIINHIDEPKNYGDMKFKHVCGLIVKGKLVSIGNNHFRNSFNNNIVPSIHAEIHALMQYLGSNNVNKFNSHRLKKSDIVVIRKSKNENINQFLESRPCSECISVLKKVGVRNVYYSNVHGNIIKECVPCMEPKYITHGNQYLSNKKNYLD